MRKFIFVVFIFAIFVTGCAKSKEDNNFESLEELNQPQYKIGAVVGAASEPYVAKNFPNAVEKQFSSISDMVIALEKKQIDAIVYTHATLENVLNEKPNTLQILSQPVGETDIHMAISPNTKLKNLQNEVNSFIKAKKNDGTLGKIYNYWFTEHNTEMPSDIPKIQGATKKLIVGTSGKISPQSFYVGDKLTGFDIEIITRFAAEYGYEIGFRVEDTVSLLTDAEFGRIDLIAGSIMYTEERAERVIFPETPLYSLPISVMTRKIFTEKDLSEIQRPTDLNETKFTVGIVTGSSSEGFVQKILPQATLKHFSSVGDMILALEEHKIDAGVYSQPSLEVALKEHPEKFKLLEDPLLNIPSSIIMRNEDYNADNFLKSLKISLEKTLIRENRYKMILDGLKVTLILSVGSLIFGTILGFIFCLIKRSTFKPLSTAMTAFIALISGLPIVLTLMICFYIVFAETNLNEIIIAIIAFAIDFGCYVAIILNSGIESVAVGEIEAAQSLGMNKLQIFRKIVFPQAIQKIFGVYKRQVISLIKSTSIVGYIAVQDLTKISDIIRARTYEAFFSLIFTAAIYFAIARICIFLLDFAEKKLNRRKRHV